MNILLVLISKGSYSDVLEGVTSKIFRSLLSRSVMSIIPLTFSLYTIAILHKFETK